METSSQRINIKIDDLMIELFFKTNRKCITCLFLFFTARTNIQKFYIETSTGRLRDPVGERPRDQIMGRPREMGKTFTKYVFQIQLTNPLNLLWQAGQDLIMNGSSKNFSEQYSS